MADGFRYELAAKTGHQHIVVGNQLGNRLLQKSNGALLLMGKFIEHRCPGRKSSHNFAFCHL